MINFLKILIFIAILVISVYFINNSNAEGLSEQAVLVKLIVVFISGLFYTSFLTAPLAVVLIVSIAFSMNPYLLAAVGGLGAVAGDLLIIKIFRTIFSAFSFIRHKDSFKSLKKTLRACHLDLIAIIIGSFIVASPFPDELGLILLGASRLSYFKLAVFTFLLNSIGILIIVLITRAIK